MAPRPVMPNAENCSLAELETAARASPTQRGFVRLMAMRTLLLGHTPAQTAAIYAVTRRTLQNWIARFNSQGIDGLIDRKSPGRSRKIAPRNNDQYRQLVEEPAQAGVTHWTGKKFHGYLSQTLELEVGYRTVLRWLHEQGFRLKVPQPWPDRQDEQLRAAFCEQVRGWLEDEQLELWYMDEMGVEGDPRPRRRWVQKGVRARVTHNGDHLRMNVSAMVCPRSGEFFALEFSHSDSVILQTFLNEANQSITPARKRNLLICDNASWHKNKSIAWGVFEPVFLPPYSPDLNPIEKLWLLIKAEWFTDFVARNRPALMARLDQALCWAMKRQPQNQKTCAIRKNI